MKIQDAINKYSDDVKLCRKSAKFKHGWTVKHLKSLASFGTREAQEVAEKHGWILPQPWIDDALASDWQLFKRVV